MVLFCVFTKTNASQSSCPCPLAPIHMQQSPSSTAFQVSFCLILTNEYICVIFSSVLSSFLLVPLHLIFFNMCFIYSITLQQVEQEPNTSKQFTSLLNSFTMNQYQIKSQTIPSSLTSSYFSSDTVPTILLTFLQDLCEFTITVNCTPCTKNLNFNVTKLLILCQKCPY